MKNVLLIMLILFSTNCFGQEIIDVNYSKYLKITSMSFDKNQNEKIDSSEFISANNTSIVLDYKDFGSAGNILDVFIAIDDKIKFKKKYRDIILYRIIKDNDVVGYIAENKYNKTLFIIVAISKESKSYCLAINDLTILDIE